MDDKDTEEALQLLESTANMLRGMTLDPAIPKHAKDAMHQRIKELEGFVERHVSDFARRIAGSKFRPVNWADLSKPGAPVIGWGLEQKKLGERLYRPVGYDGKIHPFASKAEAQTKCDELNGLAQQPDTPDTPR